MRGVVERHFPSTTLDIIPYKSHNLVGIFWAHTGALGCIVLNISARESHSAVYLHVHVYVYHGSAGYVYVS